MIHTEIINEKSM